MLNNTIYLFEKNEIHTNLKNKHYLRNVFKKPHVIQYNIIEI